jgi:hypothetical protein
MEKELPYFKFNASEWISGDITLENLTVQGAFINICAYYWFKSGSIKLSEIKRRLELKQPTINRLIEGNHIKVDGDDITITFLDDQFALRGVLSKTNSVNGSKGGAPIGNRNAEKNNRKTTEKQPKSTNIEKEQEQEKEQEKELNVLFSDFWNKYDHKINKEKCEAKWCKLKDEERIAIMETLDAYLKSTPDKKYRKHPLTYLNNRGWEDEIVQPPPFNDWKPFQRSPFGW